MSRALPLLLTCLLVACARVPAARTPRPAPPPANPPLAAYVPPGVPGEALEREVVRRTTHHVVEEVTLAARVPADLRDVPRSDDPIRITRYRPWPMDDLPRPLVLMSPVLANNEILMPEFATGFVNAGFQTAIVWRKELDFDPERSLDQAEEEVRVLLVRLRQALDWLVTQPDVDGERVGTFAVSAGAIIHAAYAAVDDRPRAHVLVLAGGPLADVLLDTEEDRFRRYERAILASTDLDRETIRRRLREVIRSDPVRLAPHVDRDRVLLFLARHDRSVPTRHGEALWEALGRPALRWLPFGHYTSFALYPWIQHEATTFLRSRLR